MAKKLLIVQGDAVRGTDQHKVTGTAPTPSGDVFYSGVGSYEYVGAMTDELSDFVRIAGKPVALTTSRSSLDPKEKVKHSGPAGSKFIPAAPAPNPMTLEIRDPIGVGKPSVSAGSGFVSVGGRPVLLGGNRIDTCDGLGRLGNSTVTSSVQGFVSASE